MPDKRDADKKLIAAWIPSELKQRIEAAAKRAGQNVSQFIEEQLLKVIEALEGRHNIRRK